jgi:hypothetical protein
MKANQLATLVLRLLGIYCLIEFMPAISASSSTIPYVFAPTQYPASEHDNNSLPIILTLLVLLLLAVHFVIGILLIVKSVPWGGKLVPSNTDQTTAMAVSFEQVQTLAFAVAGVLIFAGALPQLLNSFFLIFAATGGLAKNIQSYNYNWRTLLVAIGNLLKVAFGLYLFFRASRFAGFWRSLKDFGTPMPPQN